MKKIAILCLFAAFAACTKLLVPTQADADRAAQNFPGTTLAELQSTKALYEEKCGKCHKPFNPPSRTEEKWRKVVPPMARKAKLTAAQEEMILRYVLTMREARKPGK